MKFRIEKISEDIYKITEPYFSEHANIFVFCGPIFDLVVDCGIGIENLRSFLLDQKFKPQVFLTHAHFDHCGGLRYFKPTEVLVVPAIRKNLQKRGLLGLQYFNVKDFTKNAGALLKTDIPAFVSNFAVESASDLNPYKSDSISNGHFSFEILHTPGHTDDSCVLFDKAKKIIITGDTLYRGEIFCSLPNSNRELFMESLKKIQKLDFETVLPGHNEVLDKVQGMEMIGTWIQNLTRSISRGIQ